MAANDPPPVTRPIEDDEEPRRGLPSWLKVAVIFAALAGGVAYLLTGSEAEDAFVYSKLVHEVVTDPETFAGREVRVEGDLRQGSVQFREDPCEWRFLLEKQDETMPVRFPQCVVPDTFRDDYGISVTVQGRLQPDGTFVANQVVPRCPSKYEMKQKQAGGEQAPHPPME
ncbi:MAG: cytochrome c maturation protein CcmE [Myxococcota bacterium]